jgi:hypothetical protein
MHKRQSFPPNRSQKNVRTIPSRLGGRLVSTAKYLKNSKHAIQTKIVQHFGRFFHQIKVCQQIERKDSIQATCRKRRRLEAFLYLAAQNFKFFSKIQDHNYKIKSI